MQSIRQHRRIRHKLEQQLVTKHEMSEDVWTHEGRYYYREGEIHATPREPDDDLPADRRREHGHRTFISGPSLHPRHSVRSHLERDGDVERADFDPALQTDPHTINTQETLGNTTDMMITGVERPRPGTGAASGISEGVPVGVDDRSMDTDSDIDTIKKNKLIIVTFEGDCDKMDPHNWSLQRRITTTILTSLLACVVFWSSTIDATALTSTKELFHTTFEVQSLPTSMCFLPCGNMQDTDLGTVASYVSDWQWNRSFDHSAYIRTLRPQPRIHTNHDSIHALQHGCRAFTNTGAANCLSWSSWSLWICSSSSSSSNSRRHLVPH